MIADSIRRFGATLLIALLLVGLWVSTGYWAFTERQRVIAAKEDELDKLTVAVEEQTLRLFKLAESAIVATGGWIREHPRAYPGQDPAFIELVNQLRRVADGAFDIRLVDSAGGLYLIPSPTRQAVANVAERESVRVQFDPLTRGLYIGDPVVAPVDGKWIVPMTAPVVKPDGDLIIIAIVFELDRIAKIFEPQRTKPNGSITLLKNSGVTLFRTPAIAGAIGKSIAKAPDFIEHLAPIDRGRYRVKGAFDGVERLISHSHLTGYPIIIAVTASQDDALVPWHEELNRRLGIAALATLLTLYFAWVSMRAERVAQLRLKESERRFRTLVEHAPDAILVVDVEQQLIVDANPAAEKMFDCNRSELLGGGPERFYVAIQPDGLSAEDSIRGAQALALKGESVVIERRICSKSGRRFTAEVRLDDMSNDSNRLIRGSFIDISERKRAEKILRESEKQIRLLFNSGNDAILVYESDSLSGAPLGRFVEVNDIACSRLGYSREELMKLRLDDILAPESAAHPAPYVKLAFQRTAVYETNFLTRDGRSLPVEINAHIFELNDKAMVLAVARDTTDRCEAERSLRLAASVFGSAQEGIMITDAGNRIIDVNEAFTRITGYTREESLLRNPRMMSSGHQSREFYDAMWHAIARDGHWQGELWNRRRDGEMYAQRLKVSVVRDEEGRVTHYVGLLADITLEKQQKELLEKTAHYDVLTGIPNRVLLADRMHQAIAQAQRSDELLAVGYLDLDGFKPINDNYGHEVGDAVLLEVANRLQECLRGGDTVARVGGDEFVLLLLDLASLDECSYVLQRVLESVSRPLPVCGGSAAVSASIGITLYPNDDVDAETLLRHADLAMYQAKQSGKNRFRIYAVEDSLPKP